MNRRCNHYAGKGLQLIACAFFFLQIIAGQSSEKDLRKILGTDDWSPKEQAELERGDVVVRSLPTGEKQEISTIGVLRISGLPPISLSTFRESLEQKSSQTMKVSGRFSDPAIVDDIASLELDKETVEQLRKCSVGKCDLNLSAAAITRFQNEVDWDSPDAKEKATAVMREIMLGYVRDYLARGDRALGSYDNRREIVDLAASHRLLLSRSTLINSLAPALFEYLNNFPAAKLQGLESRMRWSVVDFGLKPSVTLSHTVTYTPANSEQFFIASKQIYASRYLDASLTFTILARVSTESGVDTYLIFLDRSRSDALGGRLAGFARGMVKKESATRVKSLLDKARLRLLAAGKRTAALTDEEALETDGLLDSWIKSSTTTRQVAWAIGCIAVAIGLFFALRKRRAQSGRVPVREEE